MAPHYQTVCVYWNSFRNIGQYFIYCMHIYMLYMQSVPEPPLHCRHFVYIVSFHSSFITFCFGSTFGGSDESDGRDS